MILRKNLPSGKTHQIKLCIYTYNGTYGFANSWSEPCWREAYFTLSLRPSRTTVGRWIMYVTRWIGHDLSTLILTDVPEGVPLKVGPLTEFAQSIIDQDYEEAYGESAASSRERLAQNDV